MVVGAEAGGAGRLTDGAEAGTTAGVGTVTDTVEAGWLLDRRARRA